MNYSHPNAPGSAPASMYKTPPATKILLLVLLAAFSALSAGSSSYVLRIFSIVAGTGLFAFYYLLTFQPHVVLTVIPGFLLGWLWSGSLLSAVFSVYYAAGGAVLSLLLLKRKQKTPCVLGVSIALGAAMIVHLLIAYFVSQEALGGQSPMELYNNFFVTLRDQILTTVKKAGAGLTAAEDIAAFESYTAALPTVLTVLFDTLKPLLPSIFGMTALELAYLAVSFFQLSAKLFRCRLLVPRDFRITVSKPAGILYILCYLFLLVSAAEVSVPAAAAQNLLLLLMPGLFVVGLQSLKRRAKDPFRRGSFITTLVLLGLSLYINPAICIFIIIIDGIGEVFFGNMPSIRPR